MISSDLVNYTRYCKHSGSARENTRIPVKLKIMTGTYILQSNGAKFNGTCINSTCLLCGIALETIEHFILYIGLGRGGRGGRRPPNHF